MMKNKNLKSVLFISLLLIIINLAGNFFFHRFDLTEDHRYTLSPTTLKIIKRKTRYIYKTIKNQNY